jgi:hypothetical protein
MLYAAWVWAVGQMLLIDFDPPAVAVAFQAIPLALGLDRLMTVLSFYRPA